MKKLAALNPNEVTYWLGLGTLFVGLTRSVSLETALIVLGTVLTTVSVFNSFFVTWLSAKVNKK